MHFILTLGVLVLHAYYTCGPKCRLGRRQTWLNLTPPPTSYSLATPGTDDY